MNAAPACAVSVLARTMPLLVAVLAASRAGAAVTVIQAGADSRTSAGIGAPDTVHNGPSARSTDAMIEPYLASTSDSREDRYFARVVDSAGSGVRFTGAERAEFFVRSAVNLDAGTGDVQYQFPAHGAASGYAFYEFSVDTASTLSFAYSASAFAVPLAYAYVDFDVFTVDARGQRPASYLRQAPLTGTGTLSYTVPAGRYGLSLTAFSVGGISVPIAVNAEANGSAVANVSLSVSAVPEPSTEALWALGLGGLAAAGAKPLARARRRPKPL